MTPSTDATITAVAWAFLSFVGGWVTGIMMARCPKCDEAERRKTKREGA